MVDKAHPKHSLKGIVAPKLQENSRKLRIFIKIQGISNKIHRDVVDLDFFEGNLGGSGVCDAPKMSYLLYLQT